MSYSVGYFLSFFPHCGQGEQTAFVLPSRHFSLLCWTRSPIKCTKTLFKKLLASWLCDNICQPCGQVQLDHHHLTHGFAVRMGWLLRNISESSLWDDSCMQWCSPTSSQQWLKLKIAGLWQFLVRLSCSGSIHYTDKVQYSVIEQKLKFLLS